MSRSFKSSRRRSSRFRPGSPIFEGSSADWLSLPDADQNQRPPRLPPPAHVDTVSSRASHGERRVETFSGMFSDCGFLINDGTKRTSIKSKRQSTASSRSNPRDRWSFLNFQHEDLLELATFGPRDSLRQKDSHYPPLRPRDSSGQRDSQLTALPEIPEYGRDLESPTTLVEDDEVKYLEGSQLARLPLVEGKSLWALVFVLFVALLLSTLEQLIVGTALTAISSDLGEYTKSVWVVTAYLMAYNGFLIVFARCADIFGRRTAFMVALIIFTVSSLGCGLAQNMTQLIVFRAFQGIGGAGLFTLTLSIATEISGKARTIIQVMIPAAFGLSSGAAPVIGGAIVDYTSWRWVFLLNVPIGFVLIIIAFWTFPKNVVPLNINFGTLMQVDWPGLALFLVAVFGLNFALQEGGTDYAWSSGGIISTLVIQGICWIALGFWEVALTSKGSKTRMVPIWPSRLFSSRVVACAMLTALFSGIPLYSVYIFLPQRFQIENGLSPLSSGIHLLLVPLVCFLATGWGSGISFVINITYPLLVLALALQCIALGLMTTLPSTTGIPARLYGYETILGVGFGLALPTVSTIARTELHFSDHSVSMAAISSLRSLGGTVGLAIGNIVLSSRVWDHLTPTLTPTEAVLVVEAPEKIPQLIPDKVIFVRETFGKGFNFNTKITLYFAIVAFTFCLGCYVRKPVQLKELDEQETKAKALLDKKALDALQEAG